MKPTFKVETEALERTLRKIAPILKRELQHIVKDAAKLATRKAIEMTPPSSLQRPANKEAQRRGEAIVQSDIRRVIATASYAYSTIKSPTAASAFWVMVKGRKKDFTAAETILRDHSYNVRLRSAPIVSSTVFARHADARRRGRVPKSQDVKQITTNEAELKRYIRSKQAMVGFLAAGWMPAVTSLGVTRIPAWIKRHSAAPGDVVTSQSDGRFSIAIVNKVRFGGEAQLQRIVPYALRAARNGLTAAAERVALKAAQRAGLSTSLTAIS
jgi:hypothetical protein